MSTRHRLLAPAPPKATEEPPAPSSGKTFFDLPGELRNQIYQLALQNVNIHILPVKEENHRLPHALTRTNRQVRSEVQGLIWQLCPIRCDVTAFDFSALLHWLDRIPPQKRCHLKQNKDLKIILCTTRELPKTLPSLRKWLKYRADEYQIHANWEYTGPKPENKVCVDLRRRTNRMPEPGKQQEMLVMLKALRIPCDDLEKQKTKRLKD